MNSKDIKNLEQNIPSETFHTSKNTIANAVMIGSERRLYDRNSPAHKRLLEYAEIFGDLDVIVFTSKKHDVPTGVFEISPHIRLHATNSRYKILYCRDAIRIGKHILSKDDRKDNKSTLVTVQDPFEAGVVGLSLKKTFGTKLHVQIHGDILNPEFRKESITNKIRLFLSKSVIVQANCIRVVSNRIAVSLQKKYTLACTPVVLPIYTDMERIQHALPRFNLHEKYTQFDFIVLMLSRLEKVKNVETAILAHKKVVETYPSAGLIIIGDGSMRSSLEELVTKLNLKQSVIFEGWQEDVITSLKTADMFLNTSLHEGYCLSLIEAATSKCPIVTTDVGVVGEVLNESNVFICDTRDSDCFAEYVSKGIENKEALLRFGKKAFIDTLNSAHTKEYFKERYQSSFNEC